MPITLPPLNQAQVLHLVEQYGLNWTPQAVSQLMTWVGGNPYLVNLTLYHGKTLGLETILEQGTGPQNIYGQHLQQRFWDIQPYPKLKKVLIQVMQAAEAITIDMVTMLKLEGMGLIRIERGQAVAACDLYRDYFSQLATYEEL